MWVSKYLSQTTTAGVRPVSFEDLSSCLQQYRQAALKKCRLNGYKKDIPRSTPKCIQKAFAVLNRKITGEPLFKTEELKREYLLGIQMLHAIAYEEESKIQETSKQEKALTILATTYYMIHCMKYPKRTTR